jgi:hypothetical protein
MITSLKPNEIFVFGSNKEGRHAGGAAKQAHEQFGAEWGIGEGLTGQCYALPTMEGKQSFMDSISRFRKCAAEHPALTFLLTKVGTGIAGYSEKEVKAMFAFKKKGGWPSNIIMPKGW